MTRRYGRALRGERVREATPAGHWSTLTLLGAMSVQGVLASMTVESATDGDVFLAYLDQVLCPRLRPGQVVVMDNLAAHKVQGVRERIEATGAELLYLPPYLPTLTPLNNAGRKSNSRSVRPRRVPWKRSRRRSRRPSLPSLRRTPPLGLLTAVTGYTKYENALEHFHYWCRPSGHGFSHAASGRGKPAASAAAVRSAGVGTMEEFV